MTYSNIPAKAREALLEAVESYAAEKSVGNVAEQMNAFAAYDVAETIRGMSKSAAYRLAREIDLVGLEINPTDFLAYRVA